jgi:GNAT superfamily N-acetyltransferase
MIQLVPMNEDQHSDFMQLSQRDQMEGHVREGRWRADEADARMAELKAQFLPQGLATPDHFFWAVMDIDSGKQVGGLWIALVEEAGQRAFFVVDIQVYEPHRRRGYGTQAFLAMEEKARQMEVSTIALHVFEDNHPARAMYHRLGYAGSGSQMAKAVPQSV